MPTERFWTLANTVSLSRVVLALIFVFTPGVTGRLILVAVASSTDVVDGWIARWRGGGSRWGALIDPVADRAFAITAVGALAWDGAFSPLAVFVLLFRDLMTAAGLFVARRMPSLKGVTFVARPLGKVVTVVQFLALVVAIAEPSHVTPLVAVAGGLGVVAVADYARYLYQARGRHRDSGPEA